MELDAGAELDATECSEVASAELGGGTDLGSGRGRWMECSCNGRHESERREGSAGEQRRQSPSRERGQAESVPR